MSLGALEGVTCSRSNVLILSWLEQSELQVPWESQPFGHCSTGLLKPLNSLPCWTDERKSDLGCDPQKGTSNRTLDCHWYSGKETQGTWTLCGKILSLASTSSQDISGFGSTWCLGSTPTPREGCHLLNSRFCCLQHLDLPIPHPKQWPNPAFHCKECVMVKVPAWDSSIIANLGEITAAWHLLTHAIFFCCKH